MLYSAYPHEVRTMEKQISLNIAVDNFSYSVTTKTKCTSVAKTIDILTNINLSVGPGDMLTIMGPSGSGKSSLLNCLAGRVDFGSKNVQTKGKILYNGSTDLSAVPSFSNYVMQRDELHAFLTVYETLAICAALKMKHSTKVDRQARVEQVISDLSLQSCRDTYVGGELKKGLSGGEMKRLAIGIELLDDAPLLFLDEPTSGLDSSLAYEVLKVLNNITKPREDGFRRTVICTIHQPRSQSFSTFRNLLLLSKGETVYFGPAQGACKYFYDLGYICPSNFNPADFFLDLLTESTSHKEEEETMSKYGIKYESQYNSQYGSQYGSHYGTNNKRFSGIHNINIKGKVSQDLYDEATKTIDNGEVDENDDKNGENNGDKNGENKDDKNGENNDDKNGENNDDKNGENNEALTKNTVSTTERVTISVDEIHDLPGKYMSTELYSNLLNDIKEHEVKNRRKEAGDLISQVKDRFSFNRKRGMKEIAREIYWIFHRTLLDAYRNPFTNFVHLIVNVVTGLILGGIFFQLDDPNELSTNRVIRNIGGYLFFMSVNLCFSTFDVVLALPNERCQYNRETKNGMYTSFTYFLGKSTAEFPFQNIPGIIQMTILYWMGGLRPTVDAFFMFLLIGLIGLFAATSFMYCLGAVSPNATIANICTPLILIIFMLLAGFYLHDDDIPQWIGWLKYVSYMRYIFFSFTLNQFPPDQDFRGVSNHVALDMLGITEKRLWVTMLILFATGVGFRIAAFFAVKFANRRQGVEA